MSPHAVDNRFAHLRRLANQFGQLLAAVDLVHIAAGVDPRAVDESRIGHFEQPVAQLVEDGSFFRVVVLAREVLVFQPHHGDVSALERAQGFRLAEERVEFPERVLLHVVERVIVALSALNLHTQEDARHFGRGRHGVLVQVVQQKVDRPVVVRFARLVGSPGADELIDHLVVRLVVQEALPQVLLHPLAIDQRPAIIPPGATDEQDGPDGGPVVGVLFDILVGFQQLVDELGLFVRGSVIDKRQGFLGRGNSAQYVQKDAADPLPVGRLGRRA